MEIAVPENTIMEYPISATRSAFQTWRHKNMVLTNILKDSIYTILFFYYNQEFTQNKEEDTTNGKVSKEVE